MSDILLEKLAQYDTPTLCNVIELFDVRPRDQGYVKNPAIRANFPNLPPVVGYAATATARSTFTTDDGGYHWLEEQVARFSELSGTPIVVIQDLDTYPVAAMFGEIMCTTYKAFGAAALMTNGAGRDINEVKALGGFQLYTNGEICSHGYFHLNQLDIPVEIGGLVIYPDDLLHADRNGITSIPKAIAAEVADAVPTFIESERVYLEAIREPNVTLAIMQAARAESKAMQRKLSEKLTRKKD